MPLDRYLQRLTIATALFVASCEEDSEANHDLPDDRDAGLIERDSGRDAGPASDTAVDAGASTVVRDAALLDANRSDAQTRDSGGDGATAAADAQTATANGRSAGCGKAATGDNKFDTRALPVDGMSRTYHVRVPETYDRNRAYPLVFRWHGSGGTGTSGGLGIEFAGDQNVIVVGPDGINAGWTNRTEQNDLMFFDAMYAQLTSQYCVDLGKVFTYGFSQGGGLSNLLGCKRSSKIRGTAALAGFDRADTSCDGMPVAAWLQHDVMDPSVPIAQGRAARDRVIMRNGCSTQTTERDGCVSYRGCKDGFPVVWCETNGLGHNIAGDTAPAKVWAFFTSLP